MMRRGGGEESFLSEVDGGMVVKGKETDTEMGTETLDWTRMTEVEGTS